MITVEADVDEVWGNSIDWSGLAERAVRAAAAHSRFADLEHDHLRVEVSVRFASDAEVQALNGAWRGKHKPTNVLSFPMLSPEELDALPSTREVLLGDIVLAHGVCAAEAAEKALTVQAHATHLIVHGMLHLLGYDHESGEDEAATMEQVERNALAMLGIADPYRVTEVQT